LAIAGVAAAFSALALSGCRYNTNPEVGRIDPALPYYRVMINDDELARALVYDEPRIVRDEDGFITRVEVTVRAAAASPLRVDYRPIFKDDAGIVIQPESSWRTKHLEMRVPERIEMLPNSRNAVDYEIQFRWAR
jgi:uncharacterized protein YcfL